MADPSSAMLLASTIVTGVATLALAVLSWRALAATREQSEAVLRREHLRKLQDGVLAQFESAFGGFFSPAFDGRFLGFREGGPGAAGGEPEVFSFQGALSSELPRHFGPLWRAVGELGGEYRAFVAALQPRVRRLAQRAVDCNPGRRAWADPLEAYLFRRSLRADDNLADLWFPQPATDADKRLLLNGTLLRGPERGEIRAWARERLEAMRARYDACGEEFARARGAVALQGDCDMVGRRRKRSWLGGAVGAASGRGRRSRH